MACRQIALRAYGFQKTGVCLIAADYELVHVKKGRHSAYHHSDSRASNLKSEVRAPEYTQHGKQYPWLLTDAVERTFFSAASFTYSKHIPQIP
jgi:hypothetical protein